MDAHHRILIGLVIAALAGLVVRTHALWTAALAVYDAFALVVLGLICVTIALTPGERIRSVAQRQDVGRTVIFVFVVIAACAALFAVAFLIRTAKPERHLTIHLLLALMTVVLSWLLMHAVFGLRYAHNFYGDSDIDEEHDAAFAIHVAHWFQPDLIMVDLTTSATGAEIIAKQLQKDRDLSEVPLLCLSNFVSARQFMSAGILRGYSFLAVPVKIDQLLRGVEHLLFGKD